jgi:TetR/AcrR family transcriptional repressor of mexCD-oprJ operon
MNDVAEAAGIARATLYRYFPNRSALIDRLAELAVDAAAERLSDSRVNDVRPIEGVTRAVRALIEVGDLFIVLGRERVRPDPEAFDRGVMGPLRALIERGRAEGALRDDIPSKWATEALVALVVSVAAARPALGQEDAVAAALAVFLDGARARPAAQQ